MSSRSSSFRARILVVVVTGAVLFVVAFAWRRIRGLKAHEVAETRVRDACRAYRAGRAGADVCRVTDEFGPRPFPTYKAADEELRAADAAFARGDAASAEASLRRVVAAAHALEARGTALPLVMAARLLDGVLDRVASRPASRVVLRGVRFETAARPFEGERVHHGWRLTHWEQTEGHLLASDGAVADAIASDDGLYREMETALLAGDVARCKARGAHVAEEVALQSPVSGSLCAHLVRVVQTGRRLDAARTTLPPG